LNFENSLPELDFLVEELCKEEKVFGARLTGGGFGGAVLAWTSQDFSQADANLIALEYENEWKHKPNYHSFLPSKGACLLDHSDVKLVN
jgi:galactokinase